jgi:hypothetical protein
MQGHVKEIQGFTLWVSQYIKFTTKHGVNDAKADHVNKD